ncbi:MAG: hypothetical protein PQJ50_06220 [Spirochaetales bacterium]|nr:hypothetical protein [Spirochaetales bacterium]
MNIFRFGESRTGIILFTLLLVWSTGDLHILGDLEHHQIVPHSHIFKIPGPHNCNDDVSHSHDHQHDEHSCPLCLLADQNQADLPLRAAFQTPCPESRNLLTEQTLVIESAHTAVPRTRAPPLFSFA